VAVGVVLALLREKLDGAGEAVARAQRVADGEVVEAGGEQRRLASQGRRRMGVRVGHQAVAVQAGHPPVDRRVGAQAGLDGEDVVGEVGVAVGDGVEARLAAQGREPRRPDVRGHEVAVLAGLEGDLEQVARVQAQDGPAVGAEVADPSERGGEPGHRVQVGQIDQVVHLARMVVALVDRGDLDAQREPGLRVFLRTGQSRRQPASDPPLGLLAQPV
jgi:hypothetical protein